MGVLRVVQIGDVHFPDPANQSAPVDAKDLAFPPRVRTAIGTQPLSAVCRKLTKLIEKYDPDAIAFMGDFTDRGDPAGLRSGAEYLSRVIPPKWITEHPGKMLVCIGNHDIERVSAAPPRQRFEDVNKILVDAGLPEASIDDPKSIDCKNKHINITLYGLNSCVGCGETRFLPPMLKPVVSDELQKIISTSPRPDIIDQMIENIDTPAIEEKTITDLLEMIQNTAAINFHVVCGHHNILPQSTPRIAPYAELINAGAFRKSLLAVSKPIVYLHGHIHQDPYEVIFSPQHRKGTIISISAPLLRDGFNLIEFLSDAAGMPLGVRVRPFRRAGNHVDETSGYEIPVRSISDALFNMTRISRDLINIINADKPVYLSDVFRDSRLSKADFDSAFEELVWSGVLQIFNKDLPFDQWRLMRSV